jgi:hypothetical protein
MIICNVNHPNLVARFHRVTTRELRGSMYVSFMSHCFNCGGKPLHSHNSEYMKRGFKPSGEMYSQTVCGDAPVRSRLFWGYIRASHIRNPLCAIKFFLKGLLYAR